MTTKMTTKKKDERLIALASEGVRRTLGTPALLEQFSHVYRPSTPVNNPIPVPSVYVDNRGEVQNLAVGQHRVNLLFTRNGAMRSGDVHRVAQHDALIRGSVCVWTLQRDGTTHRHTYTAPALITIPPYVPHVFEFLDDTVLAEWWDGPFEAWYYHPYRAKVDEASAAAALDATTAVPTGGTWFEYVLRDKTLPALATDRTNCLSSSRWFGWWSAASPPQGWWTGLAIGIGLGYALGRRR